MAEAGKDCGGVDLIVNERTQTNVCTAKVAVEEGAVMSVVEVREGREERERKSHHLRAGPG
jgi:hypothetical protein